MCWQAECWRDLDRLRAQMREDFGVTRARRSPTAVRVAVWTGLGAAVAILDAAVLAIPAAVAFEALVVPRLRRPHPEVLGPLRPWRPPESYRESPEAPALWAPRPP
jgi:hypothetical protein